MGYNRDIKKTLVQCEWQPSRIFFELAGKVAPAARPDSDNAADRSRPYSVLGTAEEVRRRRSAASHRRPNSKATAPP
jgi:hypothetical protein